MDNRDFTPFERLAGWALYLSLRLALTWWLWWGVAFGMLIMMQVATYSSPWWPVWCFGCLAFCGCTAASLWLGEKFRRLGGG
jgi:hypothetical protein